MQGNGTVMQTVLGWISLLGFSVQDRENQRPPIFEGGHLPYLVVVMSMWKYIPSTSPLTLSLEFHFREHSTVPSRGLDYPLFQYTRNPCFEIDVVSLGDFKIKRLSGAVISARTVRYFHTECHVSPALTVLRNEKQLEHQF